MAITASVQPESGRIVYTRSDFPHPFQFRSSKEGMDHTVQNRPRSDLDGLVRVWPNASGLEASRCAGIIWLGFWQNATGPLPVSHFQTRFRSSTDVPDNIVRNQSGSDLVLANCVRFWPNRSGPEARLCAGIIRPASGQRFPANLDRIRHVYWVHTVCKFPIRLRSGSNRSSSAVRWTEAVTYCLNPFTAEACNISRLKDARTRLRTIFFPLL